MNKLKKEIESLLFSSGKEMTVEEISTIIKSNQDVVLGALEELKKDYDERETSIDILNDNDRWRMNVKKDYVPVVQKIVTETELSKAVEEVFRKQAAQMSTRAEQQAIEAVLKNIIKRIRDAGVDGIYGV